MLKLGLNKGIRTNRFVGATIPVQSEYQAVLDEATTQGYSLPSSGQQAIQNELVYNMKTAGIWTNLDAFYVFAIDGDSDFACLNWIDPENNTLTKVNSPIFTTNQGFKGDGTNTELQSDLGTNFTTYFTPSAGSMFYYLNAARVSSAETRIIGSTNFRLRLRNTNTDLTRFNGAAKLSAAIDFSVAGWFHVARQNDPDIKYYIGNSETVTTQANGNVSGTWNIIPAGIDAEISIWGMGAEMSASNGILKTYIENYMSTI